MRKEQVPNYLAFLRESALDSFREGKLIYAWTLQYIFIIEDVVDEQIAAAQAFVDFFADMRPGSFARSAERVRSWLAPDVTGRGLIGERNAMIAELQRDIPTRSRFSHLSAEQYSAMLFMGSLCADGHRRQHCLELIAQTDCRVRSRRCGFDITGLSFCVLRLNDWVESIRETAQRAYDDAVRRDDESALNFCITLPFVLNIIQWHGRGADRFAHIPDDAAAALQAFAESGTPRALLRFEDSLRPVIYRFMQKRLRDFSSFAARMLPHERTSCGKSILFGALLDSGRVDKAALAGYLRDRSAGVRYQALLYRASQRDSYDGNDDIIPMLCDRSARVREQARYMLRGCVDLGEYYARAVEARGAAFAAASRAEKDLRRGLLIAALLGTGDTGDRALAHIIEPYLGHKDFHISCAALESYAKLLRSDSFELCADALTNGDEHLCRTACELFLRGVSDRRRLDCATLYKCFTERIGTPAARGLLRLLLCAPQAARLPYLLELACDPAVSDGQRRFILMHCSLRQCYLKINPAQRGMILDTIERRRGELPMKLVNDILFDLEHN